jgi:hypothetical protein
MGRAKGRHPHKYRKGLAREPSDERTGVFTRGIVSTSAGRKIALYFSGRQHASENIARLADFRLPLLCSAMNE